MRVALVSSRPTATNAALARAGAPGTTCETMTPEDALARLRPGDAAIARLAALAAPADVAAALVGPARYGRGAARVAQAVVQVEDPRAARCYTLARAAA